MIVMLASCKKDTTEYIPEPYELRIPSHFPEMIIPDDNPMTVEGVELGRKLFYENRLSGDNSMACAACHAPQHAFTDINQYSTGIDGIQGNRNSMALINLGWNNFFFWDGRAATLEDQIIGPVINPIEMHDEWSNVVFKLNQDIEYKNDFFKAFGTSEIDSVLAAKAIAQFIRTMISGNSKFDVMYKFENGLAMSPEEQSLYSTVTLEEKAGYDLFKSATGADCFHCHNGPLMQVQNFSNNGLYLVHTDPGRGGVNGNPNDIGKFKIPTLRNIAYTAPYMHDGSLADLDAVIEHYSTGVEKNSPNIDPLMEMADFGGVQLDALQRSHLKAFLLTLSDPSFINNPDFQEPQ